MTTRQVYALPACRGASPASTRRTLSSERDTSCSEVHSQLVARLIDDHAEAALHQAFSGDHRSLSAFIPGWDHAVGVPMGAVL